jgi:hypothetical protein
MDEEKVLKRVKETVVGAGVEVIGLVVSQAHDAYTMYVKPASTSSAELNGPLFFVCDRVAKALKVNDAGKLQIISAQELQHIDKGNAATSADEDKLEKAATIAKKELGNAKKELDKAEKELTDAEKKRDEATASGDEKAIERADHAFNRADRAYTLAEDGATSAQKGATSAQKGVTSAQDMVTYLTKVITAE